MATTKRVDASDDFESWLLTDGDVGGVAILLSGDQAANGGRVVLSGDQFEPAIIIVRSN